MRLYEHEAKVLAASKGFPMPEGVVCSTALEAFEAAKNIGAPVAIKSQIPVGGRGKAGGILFADTPANAKKAAEKLIGSRIRDREVRQVLVEKKLDIAEEFYMGIVIDETAKCDAFLFGPGGVDVERIASEGRVEKALIDPPAGLLGFQAKMAVERAGIGGRMLNTITRLATLLYDIYTSFDATLLEVNPLAVTESGEVYAADLRMDIDDDAGRRQSKVLASFGIEPREDKGRPPTALEIEAEEIDKIDHRGVAGRLVEFDGDIGLIIGGGGASLTVMDAIYRYGGRPANYCEIGGNPTVKKIRLLTKAILGKKGIRKIAVITNVLSNTRVDLVARGVILGLMDRGIDPSKYPIVFRVPGSWEDDGFRILEKYGIKYFDRTHTMDEAARFIVELEVD